MKIYDKKLAYPYFVWMVLFTVVPLFIVVYYALTDSTGSFPLVNLVAVGGYGAVFARRLPPGRHRSRSRPAAGRSPAGGPGRAENGSNAASSRAASRGRVGDGTGKQSRIAAAGHLPSGTGWSRLPATCC